MFEQQISPTPPSPAMPPPTPPVEDIFARTDTPPVATPPPPAGVPTGFGPVTSAQAPLVAPPVNEQELFGARSFQWGKLIMIIISIGVLIAIVVGAWFGYQYFMSQRAPLAPAPAVFSPPAPVATSTPDQNPVVTPPPAPPPVVDTDSDGLTDDEEKRLGTNSERADTDIDGLIDRAEIEVYKTDPLNPDTDGDGYLDGDEVINGYDPTRPGNARLIQVPQN